jgi:hypothetical protein
VPFHNAREDEQSPFSPFLHPKIILEPQVNTEKHRENFKTLTTEDTELTEIF